MCLRLSHVDVLVYPAGGHERSRHVFAGPCMTNMTCSNAVHNASCSLITAGKCSAHG